MAGATFQACTLVQGRALPGGKKNTGRGGGGESINDLCQNKDQTVRRTVSKKGLRWK